VSSIAEVRQALVDVAVDAWGGNGYPVAAGQIVAPCVMIGGHEGSPSTMDGDSDLTIALHVLVPSKHKNFQTELDAAVEGERAITDAIAAKPRLGLGDVSAMWTGWGEYGEIEWAGQPYWQVVINVEVMR